MHADIRFDDDRARALVPALAASISVHIAAIALVSMAVTATPARGDARPALVARLVPRILAPPSALITLLVPDPSIAGRDAIIATAGPRRSIPTRGSLPEAAAPPDAPTISAGLRGGSVAVAITSVLARLGEELEHRTHDEFGFEVDAPVRLPGTPSVAYPAKALSEHREASIVAWIVVAADGSVKEVLIPDDASDFATAVADVLRHARFVPATNHGMAIRYFTMLEFDFRIGAPVARVTSQAPAAPHSGR